MIEHGVIVDFKAFLVNMKYRSPHIHGDFELCIVLDGMVSVTADTKVLEFSKGDFYILNPFSMHELKASDHALLLSVQIRKNFCTGYYPAIGEVSFDFCRGNVYLSESENEEFIRKALRLTEQYFRREKGFEFLCMGILNELMYVLLRSVPYRTITQDERKRRQERYDRIHEISGYVSLHYTEKLLLGDIAKMEDLTLSYLSHFFRDAFNMSFQEYLSALRCEKARQLLMLTDHNLLEISMESGFSDVKYMNRAFFSRYGYHPRDYRKKFDSSDIDEQQRPIFSTQEILSQEEAMRVFECLKNIDYERNLLYNKCSD